jgi:hypothetical protein
VPLVVSSVVLSELGFWKGYRKVDNLSKFSWHLGFDPELVLIPG